MGRESAHGGAKATTALPERWHYHVRANAGLTRLEVKLCFRGAVPAELRAGRDGAAGHLLAARWLSPGSGHRLRVRDGRIQLDPSLRDGCLEYTIRLDESSGMDDLMRRAGKDLIASPNAWLWRPERRSSKSTATLRVSMPEGLSAFLPWPEHDGVYRLNSQAFRFDSYAAFGKLKPVRFSHRGVPIEVAKLDDKLTLSNDALMHWLASAVDTVSIEGHFPAERLQVLAVPSGPSHDPVAFGMVARGGAGSVMLFVADNAREEALVRDWVLPHELSHLWFPFVDRDHAWLSEGLATYLQEVLRARSGVISAEDAFTGLAQGMRSARREGTGRDMRAESRDMNDTYAYRSVYWAGAAFFLMADVELRKRSAGHQSLETLLLGLRAHHPYEHTWNADDLLHRLDELAGMAVFMPLAVECLKRPFPDVEPTLAALGLREGKDGAVLDDAAPLADIRRALFSARMDSASLSRSNPDTAAPLRSPAPWVGSRGP
jgi:hypothetical protein